MVICCVFLQGKNTPLHLAAWKDRNAVVDLLLRKGAAINQTDSVSLLKQFIDLFMLQ